MAVAKQPHYLLTGPYHPLPTTAEDQWLVVATDGLYAEEERGGGGGLDNKTLVRDRGARTCRGSRVVVWALAAWKRCPRCVCISVCVICAVPLNPKRASLGLRACSLHQHCYPTHLQVELLSTVAPGTHLNLALTLRST